MPEFDLDSFKKTWQEQKVKPKYNSTEIEAMLNKSSRNYVKYILWISIAEFLIILGVNIYYSFLGDDSNSFIKILGKLGVQNSTDLQTSFGNLYLVLKTISLIITAFFVVCFYRNYRKINIESNLKKLILQIIRFKKTVNLFILANILLLIVFTAILTVFTFTVLSQQNIHLTHPTLIGFVVGIIVMTIISIVLIWIYYRVVYGIILKRLGKNLGELQKIDSQQE
ncbi:beta-carotene 15,15'-monooxygenase [Kaistella sp.]|uniref:beta-carotene 15,15'-monooxygenase n=1 Tax=Kaistella sp. TaxID=2782235 RepID=UPI002F93D4F2